MPRPRRAIPIERLTVLTCAEVGKQLGISAAAVSQAELRGLRKLKAVLVERRIATQGGRYAS
jgi:DNA-directed RNA polymerase specialized sigma subunit